MERTPRAIFFGTPEFAVPCLDAAARVAEVTLVVCQPDRPAGRGMKLKPPAVKQRALELGIEVIQPTRVRTRAFAERLAAERPDVGIVVAYGRILPRRVLDVPARGCVNVHASLLPGLRGAAPINWAIIRGHDESGVCLMQMDEGMDTGPVISCSRAAIGPEETAGDLSLRLSDLGAALLSRDLPRYLSGELEPTPQPEEGASLAPLMDKALGRVDWSAPARRVHDLIRGVNPWPGAHSFLDGKRIKLHRARVLVAQGSQGTPGAILRADAHGIEVACGEGTLALLELQPEGKRAMGAEQFCAGHRPAAGAHFSGDDAT